jgi:ParB family chromosome partitioning protein
MSDENPTAAEAGSTKAPPRRKLGRGLGALLGETRREEMLVNSHASAEGGAAPARTAQLAELPREGLAHIPVASISPLPGQPRQYFDEEAIDELAASIAARGLIQPVVVRRRGGAFQLVAGERRWRAAQKAQIHEIPAIIRDIDDREAIAIALIENIQREDLSPVEEARAYQRLAEDDGLTQAEIAEMVDKSRSHVANLQRLLTLPGPVLAQLQTGKLSMGHARALVGHEDAEQLANRVIAQGLSVREIEKLVRKGGGEARTAPRRTAREPQGGAGDADIAAVQAHLEEFLGLPVRINTDADPRSGAVTIRYRTLDQLDLICQRLTGGGI